MSLKLGLPLKVLPRVILADGESRSALLPFRTPKHRQSAAWEPFQVRVAAAFVLTEVERLNHSVEGYFLRAGRRIDAAD